MVALRVLRATNPQVLRAVQRFLSVDYAMESSRRGAETQREEQDDGLNLGLCVSAPLREIVCIEM